LHRDCAQGALVLLTCGLLQRAWDFVGLAVALDWGLAIWGQFGHHLHPNVLVHTSESVRPFIRAWGP